jgi:hypothetical protein
MRQREENWAEAQFYQDFVPTITSSVLPKWYPSIHKGKYDLITS